MTTKINDIECINAKPIDYLKVEDILKIHRACAKEYLRENLEGQYE